MGKILEISDLRDNMDIYTGNSSSLLLYVKFIYLQLLKQVVCHGLDLYDI